MLDLLSAGPIDIAAAFCLGAFTGSLCAGIVVLYAVGVLSPRGKI